MTNIWTPIDQAPEVDPLITGIHCDTRDFAVTYSYTTYTKKDHKEVYRLLHGGKVNDKFLMQQDEIIPWLKRIEAMAGGKAEWRCLNFTHITSTRGWLKYIRFYRYTEDTFVVCDWFNTPIDWRACSEETLEKEHLHTH